MMRYRVDNSTELAADVFLPPKGAWVQFFVQDLKICFETGQVTACEFGPGIASRWEGVFGAKPIQKAVEVLNQYNDHIWFMADPRYLKHVRRYDGDTNIADLFKQAFTTNPSAKNWFGIISPFMKPNPPQELKPITDRQTLKGFPCIGITPYCDIPAEHFRHLGGSEALLLDEGSGSGPCMRVFGYKHLTKLALNGTAAAELNCPYQIVESQYRADLASELKATFPNVDKLVLKSIAGSRGKGVVMLDARSTESLDNDLKKHLQDGSEFRKYNPRLVSLVEKFVSTKGKLPGKENKETLHRFAYLVVRDSGQVKTHILGGVLCYANQEMSPDTILAQEHIVKIDPKYNDADIKYIEPEDLEPTLKSKLEHLAAAAAERAIGFQPCRAIEELLSSDNPIMNLIGVEMFGFETANYREVYWSQGNLFQPAMPCARISDSQCQLMQQVLKKMPTHAELHKRIHEVSLIPELRTLVNNEVAFRPVRQLVNLIQALLNSNAGSTAAHCRRMMSKLLSDCDPDFAHNEEQSNFFSGVKRLLEPNQQRLFASGTVDTSHGERREDEAGFNLEAPRLS